MNFSKKTAMFIFFVVFFVSIDRLLKILCLKGFFDSPVPLIGNILSLHYIKNNYIAFSLPLSGPILTTIIGLIIVVILLFWLKTLLSKTSQGSILPLTILLMGAILNFTDRLKFGFIVDYFDLKWFTVFNLADIMICSGVIWLIILSFRSKKYESR